MTVCIAASCDSGRAVVVASDRMLSAPFLTVEFDHQDAKIDQVGANCVALSAGDALCVEDVLIGGLGAASQLQNPPIATLAEHIKQQFCQVRKQRINDFILGPRGLNFDVFYGGAINTIPRDLAMLIDNNIQSFKLGTTILLGGVDNSGSHINCISDPGTMACFDRVGYHAIGIGERHGLLKLVSLGQHPSQTTNETVFNVYSAKRVAELAPGVGQATSMRIVRRDGTDTVDQSLLDELAPLYGRQSSPTIDAVANAIDKLPFDKKGTESAPSE